MSHSIDFFMFNLVATDEALPCVSEFTADSQACEQILSFSCENALPSVDTCKPPKRECEVESFILTNRSLFIARTSSGRSVGSRCRPCDAEALVGIAPWRYVRYKRANLIRKLSQPPILVGIRKGHQFRRSLDGGSPTQITRSWAADMG
jgi:hypothetical protein